MRHGATSHTDQRGSALWGRGGRSATLLAIALTCLLVPTAGLAGRDVRAVVPADLLAEANANPNATFAVIVQGDKDRSSGDIADRVQSGNGKLRRAFRSVSGAAAEVTGEQLLDLARDSHVAVITRDSTVGTSAYEDNEIWRDAVAARPLWGDILSGSTPPAIAIVDSGIDATKVDDFGSRVVARRQRLVTRPRTRRAISRDTERWSQGSRPARPRLIRASHRTRRSSTSARREHGRVARERRDRRASTGSSRTRRSTDIRVVNLSMVGDTQTSFQSDPLDKAVEKLWLSGIVVVAAAGNSGAATGEVDMFGAPGERPVRDHGRCDRPGADVGDRRRRRRRPGRPTATRRTASRSRSSRRRAATS